MSGPLRRVVAMTAAAVVVLVALLPAVRTAMGAVAPPNPVAPGDEPNDMDGDNLGATYFFTAGSCSFATDEAVRDSQHGIFVDGVKAEATPVDEGPFRGFTVFVWDDGSAVDLDGNFIAPSRWHSFDTFSHALESLFMAMFLADPESVPHGALVVTTCYDECVFNGGTYVDGGDEGMSVNTNLADGSEGRPQRQLYDQFERLKGGESIYRNLHYRDSFVFAAHNVPGGFIAEVADHDFCASADVLYTLSVDIDDHCHDTGNVDTNYDGRADACGDHLCPEGHNWIDDPETYLPANARCVPYMIERECTAEEFTGDVFWLPTRRSRHQDPDRATSDQEGTLVTTTCPEDLVDGACPTNPDFSIDGVHYFTIGDGREATARGFDWCSEAEQ